MAKTKPQQKPKVLRRPLRILNPTVRISPTFYKDRVPPNTYRIDFSRGWKYHDKQRAVLNPIVPIKSSNFHLVLRDFAGQARFVLNYEGAGDEIFIDAIQRERTQFEPVREKRAYRWSAAKENEQNRVFAKQLGMHPAEFLLCEFLYRNRELILGGHRVFLSPDSFDPKIQHGLYRPLIDRFFKPNPTLVGGAKVWELSLQKERVRALLGL